MVKYNPKSISDIASGYQSVHPAEKTQRSSYLGRLKTGLGRTGIVSAMFLSIVIPAAFAGNGGYVVKNNVPENSGTVANGAVGQAVVKGFTKVLDGLIWVADNAVFKVFQPAEWREHPYLNTLRAAALGYGISEANSSGDGGSAVVKKVINDQGGNL